MALLNEVPTPANTVQQEYAFGTSEASERMIRPGANVGFFGWLAILGIPLLLLFLIYTKMENPGVVSATRADKLNHATSVETPAAAPVQAQPAPAAVAAPVQEEAKETPKAAATEPVKKTVAPVKAAPKVHAVKAKAPAHKVSKIHAKKVKHSAAK